MLLPAMRRRRRAETGMGVIEIWVGFAVCCGHREMGGYMFRVWLELIRATFEDKKGITVREY